MTELMGGLAIHLITITDNVRVKKIVLFPVMATYFTHDVVHSHASRNRTFVVLTI